jgi:hypothetical protein
MKSIIIDGLLKQGVDSSAVQMAMWENMTIWKVALRKLSSKISEEDEISNMIELERKKLLSSYSDPFSPVKTRKSTEQELGAVLLNTISKHLDIDTSRVKSIGDLDDIGVKIERRCIALQKELSKNEFKGNTIHDLIKYNMKKMFENLSKEFGKKSKDEQQKIAKNFMDVIEKMPNEQKEILRKELKVDSISEETVSKAIKTGAMGV